MSWLVSNIETAMFHSSKVTAEGYADLLPQLIRQASRDRPKFPPSSLRQHHPSSHGQRRQFHDYFVTHLPSSSLHPDSRPVTGPAHKFDRKASTPHTGSSR